MGRAPYRWLAFHLGFWRVAFEPNLSKSSSHTSILSAPCAHIHWRTNAPALRATVFSGHQIFWHLACSMREGYKCSDTCRAKFVRFKMEETIILKTYQHIMYTPSTDRYTYPWQTVFLSIVEIAHKKKREFALISKSCTYHRQIAMQITLKNIFGGFSKHRIL